MENWRARYRLKIESVIAPSFLLQKKKREKNEAWEGQKIGKITTEFSREKGDEILPFMMFRAQSIFAAPVSDFLKLIFFSFFLVFILV